MDIRETIKQALSHYSSGNLQEAARLFQSALEARPDSAEILHLLGIIHAQLGNYEPATSYLKRTLQLSPANAEAYLALGIISRQKGMTDEATGYFQKSISLNPDNAVAYSNLGSVLQERGLGDEAINAYRKAVEIAPDSGEAHTNLGTALQLKGQNDEAIACFYKAVERDPDYIRAYHGLAAALVAKWGLGEAIDVCNKALKRNENDATSYYIMGNILMTQGRLDEAEIYFKRSIQVRPDEPKPYQAFLMLISYHPGYDARSILSEHKRFAAQFEGPLHPGLSVHSNDRTVNRRLKIGYVSPDFKMHPVAYFIEPVLASHNIDHFEIFCYSDVSVSDEVTNRIKGYELKWRNIAGMSDEKVAELIRGERIDILIDLAGHTGGINRILLFARKPAPVQVSWIGYPSTTGLSTMDYKIVDDYTDPPGMTEQFYTERLLRLPETFLCYLPDKNSPDPGPLPALSSGHITFGSFNNYVKVTSQVIRLWSKILKEVKGSRLLMKSMSFFDRTTRTYAKNLFEDEGIRAERIELLQPVPSVREHLGLYRRIDIGLDTFPYNGTTTTCEAMWMGVPVITLEGNVHSSRVGVSLLSNVGLEGLIAKTYDQYVDIARQLSADIKELSSLRAGLRDTMAQSPLTDAKRFTMNIENCYRSIWADWSESH
jgi:protein O-GlcNAc transferase